MVVRGEGGGGGGEGVYVTVFNPTREVTFRLCGWCTLGVFFVARIHPSRTYMSGSFSPCDGMHVCTDTTSVYTLL